MDFDARTDGLFDFMLVGFTAIVFAYICLCLYLGEVQGGFFTDLRRNEHPTAYWLNIAFTCLCETILVWVVFSRGII